MFIGVVWMMECIIWMETVVERVFVVKRLDCRMRERVFAVKRLDCGMRIAGEIVRAVFEVKRLDCGMLEGMIAAKGLDCGSRIAGEIVRVVVVMGEIVAGVEMEGMLGNDEGESVGVVLEVEFVGMAGRMTRMARGSMWARSGK